MSLKKLHEGFIDAARRPMTFGRLPIEPRPPDRPIIPMDRWELIRDAGEMLKTYSFRQNEQRDDFVRALLAYEATVQHRARVTIDDGEVTIVLTTRNMGIATEIDKEYARYMDILYKDVVYSSRYEQEDF